MYKTLMQFVDGENGKAWPPEKGGFHYAAGDPYPREGFNPGEKHIQYLLGKENRFGTAVIREIAAQTVVAKKSAQDKTTQKSKGGGANGTGGAAETPPEPDGRQQG